jgi:bifunctional UDP-N-acetylglucosamine pyrophosphorylase/glucosamine-1-phosphate N-acetyltransferase
MKSSLPKVLHPLAGVAMVTWAVDAALDAGTEQVVLVVGHGREKVMEAVRQRFGERVDFAVQHEQRGTADAVRAGIGAVRDDVTEVMITYGDVPCVPAAALQRLAAARGAGLLSLLTMEVDDPTGESDESDLGAPGAPGGAEAAGRAARMDAHGLPGSKALASTS